VQRQTPHAVPRFRGGRLKTLRVTSPHRPPLPLPAFAGTGFAGTGFAGAGLVAIARGPAPDPIPNSAVKTLSAHGTAAQAAEESVAARPPPRKTCPRESGERGSVYPSRNALFIRRQLCAAIPTRAGWSSPVARQAHNLKVVGSNPTPATIKAGTPERACRLLCWAANDRAGAPAIERDFDSTAG
jgi:hypothetical protein